MARRRIERGERVGDISWVGPPWSVSHDGSPGRPGTLCWADRDDLIGARVAAFSVTGALRPFRDEPAEALLSLLAGSGPSPGSPAAEADLQRFLLEELACRGPQPAILSVLDRLPLGELRDPLLDVLARLGAEALPAVRSWAATPGHPMCGGAIGFLADHGAEPDVPELLAAWERLEADPANQCGYDRLAAGLARIGGDRARAIVPRLHRLWFTPHSFERVEYLRALLVLDPGNCRNKLIEGVFDCEPGVRLLAVEHAPLIPTVRRHLPGLAGDPLEDDEVRAAVRRRLGHSPAA